MEMKKFDPHKAEKDVEVGDFYYKRQNYRAAASRYKEAIDLKPAYPVATFKLADALEKSKQFDDAAVFYREYVREFPTGEQAAAAREALARIAPNLKADPARLIQEQVTRDMKAGETFLASRNYPDAINRFCDVAAAQPTNARGFFRLAQSLQQIGEFPSAYADYETYLKLEPDGPFADDARTEMQRLRPQLQGSVTSPSAGTRP
jgi:predicted TPR repeat methyltransferase